MARVFIGIELRKIGTHHWLSDPRQAACLRLLVLDLLDRNSRKRSSSDRVSEAPREEIVLVRGVDKGREGVVQGRCRRVDHLSAAALGLGCLMRELESRGGGGKARVRGPGRLCESEAVEDWLDLAERCL
jgi:hypothetical protein